MEERNRNIRQSRSYEKNYEHDNYIQPESDDDNHSFKDEHPELTKLEQREEKSATLRELEESLHQINETVNRAKALVKDIESDSHSRYEEFTELIDSRKYSMKVKRSKLIRKKSKLDNTSSFINEKVNTNEEEIEANQQQLTTLLESMIDTKENTHNHDISKELQFILQDEIFDFDPSFFQAILERAKQDGSQRSEKLKTTLHLLIKQQEQLFIHILEKYKHTHGYYRIKNRGLELDNQIAKLRHVLNEKKYKLQIRKAEKEESAEDLRKRFEIETEKQVRTLLNTLEMKKKEMNQCEDRNKQLANELDNLYKELSKLLYDLDKEEKSKSKGNTANNSRLSSFSSLRSSVMATKRDSTASAISNISTTSLNIIKEEDLSSSTPASPIKRKSNSSSTLSPIRKSFLESESEQLVKNSTNLLGNLIENMENEDDMNPSIFDIFPFLIETAELTQGTVDQSTNALVELNQKIIDQKTTMETLKESIAKKENELNTLLKGEENKALERLKKLCQDTEKKLAFNNERIQALDVLIKNLQKDQDKTRRTSVAIMKIEQNAMNASNESSITEDSNENDSTNFSNLQRKNSFSRRPSKLNASPSSSRMSSSPSSSRMSSSPSSSRMSSSNSNARINPSKSMARMNASPSNSSIRNNSVTNLNLTNPSLMNKQLSQADNITLDSSIKKEIDLSDPVAVDASKFEDLLFKIRKNSVKPRKQTEINLQIGNSKGNPNETTDLNSSQTSTNSTSSPNKQKKNAKLDKKKRTTSMGSRNSASESETGDDWSEDNQSDYDGPRAITRRIAPYQMNLVNNSMDLFDNYISYFTAHPDINTLLPVSNLPPVNKNTLTIASDSKGKSKEGFLSQLPPPSSTTTIDRRRRTTRKGNNLERIEEKEDDNNGKEEESPSDDNKKKGMILANTFQNSISKYHQYMKFKEDEDKEFYAQTFGVKVGVEQFTILYNLLKAKPQILDTPKPSVNGEDPFIIEDFFPDPTDITKNNQNQIESIEQLREQIDKTTQQIKKVYKLNQYYTKILKEEQSYIDLEIKKFDIIRKQLINEVTNLHWSDIYLPGVYQVEIKEIMKEVQKAKKNIVFIDNKITKRRVANIRMSRILTENISFSPSKALRRSNISEPFRSPPLRPISDETSHKIPFDSIDNNHSRENTMRHHQARQDLTSPSDNNTLKTPPVYHHRQISMAIHPDLSNKKYENPVVAMIYDLNARAEEEERDFLSIPHPESNTGLMGQFSPAQTALTPNTKMHASMTRSELMGTPSNQPSRANLSSSRSQTPSSPNITIPKITIDNPSGHSYKPSSTISEPAVPYNPYNPEMDPDFLISPEATNHIIRRYTVAPNRIAVFNDIDSIYAQTVQNLKKYIVDHYSTPVPMPTSLSNSEDHNEVKPTLSEFSIDSMPRVELPRVEPSIPSEYQGNNDDD